MYINKNSIKIKTGASIAIYSEEYDDLMREYYDFVHYYLLDKKIEHEINSNETK